MFCHVSDGFLYGFSWCCNWTSPQTKDSGLSQALLPTSTGRDGEIGPSPLYSLEFQLWWQPWTALKCPHIVGPLICELPLWNPFCNQTYFQISLSRITSWYVQLFISTRHQDIGPNFCFASNGEPDIQRYPSSPKPTQTWEWKAPTAKGSMDSKCSCCVHLTSNIKAFWQTWADCKKSTFGKLRKTFFSHLTEKLNL